MGYGRSGYGYDYIHRDRGYDKSRPLKCVTADVTEYIKTREQAQELNVDEDEKTCDSKHDVCFGRMTITTLAKEEKADETLGLEVKIEKGCGVKAEFEEEETDSAFEANRKCWVGKMFTKVKEKGRRS